LSEDQQKRFDEYRVVVRDLAARPEAEIREIFRRINATDYSLKQVEKLNAMFSGAYQRYCHDLSKQDFFSKHKVFRKADVNRMKDVTFCTTLVTTLLSTYFRRDEENAQFLERYNEEFPQATSIQQGLDLVFSFIEDGGFPDKCRVWGQTHLFTLIVELHQILVKDRRPLDAVACGQSLTQFYSQVEAVHRSASEDEGKQIESRVFRYYQAALKATNEKYTRVARGEVIAEVLLSVTPPPKATKPKRERKKRGV